MKIKKYLKKNNYLLQLFFTIACLCCIPLILLQFFVIGQSVQGYSKMNEETIYENLAGGVAWFRKQTEQMSQTAIKISQDPVIRNAAKKDCSPYKIYEAHNRIDQYSNDQYESDQNQYDGKNNGQSAHGTSSLSVSTQHTCTL